MSRHALVERVTQETRVRVEVDLDQPRAPEVVTEVPLFTHFLQALGHHGRFALSVEAAGDVAVDPHHLIEDVGIALGAAVRQALGNGAGIRRYGQRWLPMDEALVLVVVDISGRGQCYWDPAFPNRPVGGVAAEVWPEFFRGFARSGGITLHLRLSAGENAHHIYEAAFKGLGQALAEAVAVVGTTVPSTKGVL